MVSPKAMAVAGLSAIAVAASGCGGDPDSSAEFRAAFKKSFGEAPWYHHITGMKISSEKSTWLEITTDTPESDTQRGICGAAMRFALDHEVGDGIKGVRMMGPDGMELGGCG